MIRALDLLVLPLCPCQQCTHFLIRPQHLYGAFLNCLPSAVHQMLQQMSHDLLSILLLRYHFPPHLYTCSHLPILLCQFWSQTSSADRLPDYCVTYVLVFVHAIVWPYCLCNLFLCLFCCCLHQRTWEVHEILVNRKKNTCLCDCVAVGTDEQKVWFRASSALCCYSIGFLWFFDLDFYKPHSLWVRNIRLFAFPNAKNGTAATVV